MQKEGKMSRKKTISIILAIIFSIIIICYFSIVVAFAIEVLVEHVKLGHTESFLWQDNLNYYVNQLLKTLVIFSVALPIMGLILNIIQKKYNKASIIVSITVSVVGFIYIFLIDKIYWKTNIILTSIIIIASFVAIYIYKLFKPKVQNDQ